MDSLTRGRIMDLISDLSITENCPTFEVINMLYGSFDGYDYSERIKVDSVIESLNKGGNTHLSTELLQIVSVIEQYPRTKVPNSGNF
jgi:hypothetical protein